MRISSTGKSGFTLVELIVVVVIITVMTSMVAPRLSGATGRRQLRASARQLMVAAQYARNYAVTHRCACRIVFDRDGRRYNLAYQVDPEHRPGEFEPLPHSIGKVHHLVDGLRFSKIWIEPKGRPDGTLPQRDSITFYPVGRCDAAVIEITDGASTYSMLVSPASGRARLVAAPVSELPNDQRDLDG